MENTLISESKDLVIQNIEGFRAGDRKEPAYMHSLRVGDLLATLGYHKHLVVAGYLHDILEDSPITSGYIESNFGSYVSWVVNACTHNKEIKDKGERWLKMMKHIDKEEIIGAFIVKFADVVDNMKTVHELPIESQKLFIDVKVPYFLDHKYGRVYKKLYTMLEEVLYNYNQNNERIL